MVQKIAFDQVDHSKIIMLYRILKDKGYLYRMRIYDIDKLECKTAKELADKSDDESLKSAVASIDDIEEIFDALSEGDDKQFTEGNMDFDYEDSKRGIFEDFVFPTKSRITAIHFYGGDTITYCQYPDFYEFRTLKRTLQRSRRRSKDENEDDTNNQTGLYKSEWKFDKFGPFLYK